MDALQLLVPLLALISTYEWRSVSATSNSTCSELDLEHFKLLEGESFYFVPYDLDHPNSPDENFTWYKNGLEVENITTDETHETHHHGGALFLLNVSTADSGSYTAKQTTPSGNCVTHHVSIKVFNGSSGEDLTYGAVKNSKLNKVISCPSPVKSTCDVFKGKFTWYKGANLRQGEHEAKLRVFNATEEDEDIYTCVCTWTHNHHVYKTSGSRRLIKLETNINRDVQILSPNNKEQLADEGVGIKLNCTIFCGTNVKRDCKASWHLNNKEISQMTGYNQATTREIEEPSKNTYSTAILTIDKVSAKDFQQEFVCKGQGLYTYKETTLTLKQRESIIPLAIGGVCVFFICVLAATLVKCFAIDLALFFRPYLHQCRHNQDGSVYDAFVIYETEDLDEDAEDKLLHFVTVALPSVLEEKCGYQLFIQGRDDIPGEVHHLEDEKIRGKLETPTGDGGNRSRRESHASLDTPHPNPKSFQARGLTPCNISWICSRDLSLVLGQTPEEGDPEGHVLFPPSNHLVQVEKCLNQSNRLMVILTSGSASGIINKCPTSNQSSVIGGFDWQVGIHHALVQREMSVILVQLGDTRFQGYTHLPPGLQHLIRKSAPIRWSGGLQSAAAQNSSFWKRVRYLMPATPAKKRALSAVV
ncbi:interleukin-1 receptor-like 1 isoform X2 [Nothobranchius furzeri]|uniref:interleukin-1 receptor-like 1 isoform X2 n=1 Tax=Nothobranchius furzeri TaxID=105023 RepID=UPI003904835D